MHSLDLERQSIIDVALRLSKEGLVERTWGNVSLKLDYESLLITPTGANYDTLEVVDIPCVNFDGASYSCEEKKPVVDPYDGCIVYEYIKPSSETPLHGLIYETFPKVQCVLHTHQKWASLLGLFCSGRYGKIDVPSEYQIVFGEFLPCAEYAEAGTEDIACNIVSSIQSFFSGDDAQVEKGVVLMPSHGVVVFALDFSDAFFLIEMLETMAKSMIQAQIKLYSKIIKHPYCDPRVHYYTALSFFEENANIFRDAPPAFIDGFSAFLKKYSYVLAVSHSKAIFCVMDLVLKQDELFDIPCFFDDVAQIAGSYFHLIKKEEITDDNMINFKEMFADSKVVFVEGIGALCVALDKDELTFMTRLLEKNIYAFILSQENKKIRCLDEETARSLHFSYIKGYSKLRG